MAVAWAGWGDIPAAHVDGIKRCARFESRHEIGTGLSIGYFIFIFAFLLMVASVVAGAGADIAMNASLLPCGHGGAYAVASAGSVVADDVPE